MIDILTRNDIVVTEVETVCEIEITSNLVTRSGKIVILLPLNNQFCCC